LIIPASKLAKTPNAILPTPLKDLLIIFEIKLLAFLPNLPFSSSGFSVTTTFS